jgi:hypothetical protein
VRTAVLVIDDVPPSLNTVATSHWRKYGRIKKAWQGYCEGALMAEAVPRRLKAVKAKAILTFPQDRRRDEGNFRFFVEKALGDALTNGGWLADDTAEQYTFGAIEFEKGRKRTTIRLEFE